MRAAPVRTLTPKGAASREAILRATQRAVAEFGVAGVSHRIIAEIAGVKLSMTSYYFGSLDQLLEAAWDDLRQNGAGPGRALRDAAERIVAALPAPPVPAADRLAAADALARLFARHVITETSGARATAIASDCSFLFAWTLPPGLRAKVVAHTQAWNARAQALMARAGSADPANDGAALLAAMRYQEFAHCSYARGHADTEQLTAFFTRLLRGLLRV